MPEVKWFAVWACSALAFGCAAGGAGGSDTSKQTGSVKTGDAGALDAANGSDSGGFGSFGNSDAHVGLSSTSDASAAKEPPACATQDVQTRRVTPTVMLIVDRSGSMTEPLSATTRWEALRSFLLAPQGLIDSLQTQVRFGLAMYSGLSTSNPDAGDATMCPVVSSVPPALGNYAAIAQTYNAAQPLSGTPTGASIDHVTDSLMLDAQVLDQDRDPVVYILATDGEPDTCGEPDPTTPLPQQQTIAAVSRAYSLGVKTFIISVGSGISAQHQQDVANAGLGRAASDPDAQYWNATDDTTLRAAIEEIVGQQLSCDIELDGKVEGGDPCDGEVLLNGEKLACSTKSGFSLLDASHIRLHGQACEDLQSLPHAQLHVTFPCSVSIVF